ERGGGVGGTWYWNRYPGARCDVPSLEYSYQFSEELQQEWEWSEKYATQPEILRYAEHVADRFDLRRDISFDTTVTSLTWQGESWHVATTASTSGGGDAATSNTASATSVTTARFVVLATGCLSAANVPRFTDDRLFAGRTYHTGNWPHEGVDFTGQRVAVIGTGSSGIQSVPIIASQAAHLTVLQRTPAYSVPARNQRLSPDYVASIKANYGEFRRKNSLTRAALGGDTPTGPHGACEVSDDERRAALEARWQKGGLLFLGAFNDALTNPESNRLIADFVRDKIRQTVRDPEIARRLSPDSVIGCKRLCVDTDYYETFNRSNVSLIDLRETPIERFTRRGIIVGDATELEFDAIVFATGFDAMTGAISNIDIRGRDDLLLRNVWSEGPLNYLGLAVHGFPNLFMITGPGSPSVLTNMIVSIQHHVEWITDCLVHLRRESSSTIEADPSAQAEWVQHVNTIAGMTLYTSCSSWYLGANMYGKPRVFMPLPGFPAYVQRCTDVAQHHYQGFHVR
ncbi:MAG: NAD(P)/FAD-dependent oxidoreductase, partial [Acidimicrobiia bacterium]|nr:NAD(P)/FAD-dependent oxidoreductase [Acidimicrobiia bacterium]